MHRGRVAPGAGLRGVHARSRDIHALVSFYLDGEDEDEAEGPPMAVAVVAPIRRAEHGRGRGHQVVALERAAGRR